MRMMMDVVILVFILAAGILSMPAIVVGIMFVVIMVRQGVSVFLVLKAVRAFAVRMSQAGDLGRGEHCRDEDRREKPALRADPAISERPDHIYPAVMKKLTGKYMSFSVSIQP